MTKVRLNRRAVLRGAGSIALALPWLEAMAEEPARADAKPAKRFLAVFTPGGTVLEKWRPTGTVSDFSLSPILSPLDALREHVLIVGGVDMVSAVGEQNQAGLIAWLTGAPQAGNGYAEGPSIDQVLAPKLSAGKPHASVELAIRWGTGKAHGLKHPIDIANYANTPAFDPIVPQIDPTAIWKNLVGEAQPGQNLDWDKSILDAVGARYQRLSAKLGAADRQRLEQHGQRIRDLEKQLASVCQTPAAVDTSDYDPFTGLQSADDGSIVDAATDAAIPKVGKLFMDLLVFAFSCDLTGVATLMWSDTEAKHTFPWLGLNQHLHYYMNDGGYQPAPLTTIFNWYVTQHAYLIGQLAKTRGPKDQSLLDDTLIFFGSNLQHPATHAKTDMPFLLAGGGGGLRGNRYLDGQHASHNDLLVSLCNLCGDGRQVFGDPQYCKGPLGGIT